MAGTLPAAHVITFWSPGRSGATTLAAGVAAALAGGLPEPGRPLPARLWAAAGTVRDWVLADPAASGRSPDAGRSAGGSRRTGARGAGRAAVPAAGSRPGAPLRVHAADLNRLAPSLGQHLGLFPPRRPADHCLSRLLPALAAGRLQSADLAAALVPAPGLPHLRVLPGCYDPWAGGRLQEEQARTLIQLLAAGARVLVLDASPQLDCPATFAALAMAQTIVLVAGPGATERLHARRYLLALKELGWGARVLLAMNRAPWGARRGLAALVGPVGPGQVAAELGRPVAAPVADYPALPVLLEEGKSPYRAARGRAGAAFCSGIEKLAREVLAGGRH